MVNQQFSALEDRDSMIPGIAKLDVLQKVQEKRNALRSYEYFAFQFFVFK